MKPPREVPAAIPAPPVVERTQRIKISLGNKRYVLKIAVKPEQLKPPPAPVIEIPAPLVEPDGAAERKPGRAMPHRVILVETQKALRAAAAATSVVLEVPLDNDLLDCTLSPDVSQVAAHTNGGRLVAINLQSKARTDLGMRLPNAAAYPNAIGHLQWSSDGHRIGYQSVASRKDFLVADLSC